METTPTINVDPREIFKCLQLINGMIADALDETVVLGDPDCPQER